MKIHVRPGSGEDDQTESDGQQGGALPVAPAGPEADLKELRREAAKIEDSVHVDHHAGTAPRMIVDIPALTVVKVVAILFALYLVQQIWPLITILAVALMLAAALSPYLALLERHGFNRGLALATIALSLVLGFSALIALVVPSLVSQTRDLWANSNSYVASLQSLMNQHGLHVNILKDWKQFHANPGKQLGGLRETAVNVAFSIFDSAVALFTVLFITLYLLSDQERIRAFLVGLAPQNRRADALAILHELRRQVGGYVRGQLITSLLAAVFSFIVLTVFQIPHATTLAVYVGIADLVPLFGSLLGTVPAVLIALTISPLRAVGVLIGFIIYQQIENHYIVPRVYARTMRISPLVALVGLLVGARLLGMLGMLVALPVVAALPVILGFLGIHLRTGTIRAEPDASRDVAP